MKAGCICSCAESQGALDYIPHLPESNPPLKWTTSQRAMHKELLKGINR